MTATATATAIATDAAAPIATDAAASGRAPHQRRAGQPAWRRAALAPHRRRARQPARWRAARSWTLLLGAVLALSLVGCRVAGSAAMAPYRTLPLGQLRARPVVGAAGVLALSPDGALQAEADRTHGICLRSTGAAAAPAVCAAVRLAGSSPVTALFSADGRWLAMGQNVTARGGGPVWLVDPRTGDARPVPAASSSAPSRASAAGSGSGGPAGGSASGAPGSPAGGAGGSPGAPGGRSVPAYTGMLWSAAGDLLLISSGLDPDGPRTRLVDVDPESLVPRVVAQATGPYEFQSGYVVTGGTTVLFTVYRGDQLVPNLVDVDLGTGVRREIGPIGPAGTQVVPLAVSPNGRVAVVGSATLQHPGPPRLLTVGSGALTDIPGLSGDFDVAAFSPDGARAAVVSTGADGRQSLAVTVVGATPLPPARTLGTVDLPVRRGLALTWSRFDVLSLAGPAAAAPGVIGWRLSG